MAQKMDIICEWPLIGYARDTFLSLVQLFTTYLGAREKIRVNYDIL